MGVFDIMNKDGGGFREGPIVGQGGGLQSKLRTAWDSYNAPGENSEFNAAQRARAAGFADLNQGNYLGLGDEANAWRQQQRRIASGQDSVSRLQLAQALQQNQAQQQSMAAGARGGNQAMAARQAAMNAGRLGAGLAGQQAIAGIQERQAAQNALAQQLMAQRSQDLSGILGSRGQAIQGGGKDGPSKWEKGLDLAKRAGMAYLTYGGSEAVRAGQKKKRTEYGDDYMPPSF